MKSISCKALFILSTAVLLVCFQNFSYKENPEEFHEVDLALLKSPEEPTSGLAVPQGGHDLNSVLSDWSSRQKDILLEGRDQVLLEHWNQKLQDFFASAPSEESAEPDTSAPAKGSRGPASIRLTQINEVEYQLDPSTSATCSYNGNGADFRFAKDLGSSKIVLRHQSADGSTSVNFNLNF